MVKADTYLYRSFIESNIQCISTHSYWLQVVVISPTHTHTYNPIEFVSYLQSFIFFFPCVCVCRLLFSHLVRSVRSIVQIVVPVKTNIVQPPVLSCWNISFLALRSAGLFLCSFSSSLFAFAHTCVYLNSINGTWTVLTEIYGTWLSYACA